jgi:hypothetical protein
MRGRGLTKLESFLEGGKLNTRGMAEHRSAAVKESRRWRICFDLRAAGDRERLGCFAVPHHTLHRGEELKG